MSSGSTEQPSAGDILSPSGRQGYFFSSSQWSLLHVEEQSEPYQLCTYSAHALHKDT